MIAAGPPAVVQRTDFVRTNLAAVVDSPNSATTEGFRAGVQGLVAGPFAAQFDEWFTTLADVCGAELSTPYKPIEEGIGLVTE